MKTRHIEVYFERDGVTYWDKILAQMYYVRGCDRLGWVFAYQRKILGWCRP